MAWYGAPDAAVVDAYRTTAREVGAHTLRADWLARREDHLRAILRRPFTSTVSPMYGPQSARTEIVTVAADFGAWMLETMDAPRLGEAMFDAKMRAELVGEYVRDRAEADERAEARDWGVEALELAAWERGGMV